MARTSALSIVIKTVFESFISRIKLSNPDVTAALLEMKQQIDNEVFHEWCDSLILCQNDRSLKSTLKLNICFCCANSGICRLGL